MWFKPSQGSSWYGLGQTCGVLTKCFAYLGLKYRCVVFSRYWWCFSSSQFSFCCVEEEKQVARQSMFQLRGSIIGKKRLPRKRSRIPCQLSVYVFPRRWNMSGQKTGAAALSAGPSIRLARSTRMRTVTIPVLQPLFSPISNCEKV